MRAGFFLVLLLEFPFSLRGRGPLELMMKDDRLAKNVDELERVLAGEVAQALSMPSGVRQTLAQIGTWTVGERAALPRAHAAVHERGRHRPLPRAVWLN